VTATFTEVVRLTVAVAFTLGSAAEVAVTVAVPACAIVAGAV
jgi:hypothetical protein